MKHLSEVQGEHSMSNTASGSRRDAGIPDSGHSAGPESRGERRLISPFRCRVWTQHSRPEEQLTEDACKSLRESIAKNGQHQPALGRPVTDDPDYDVEIICGSRRHAAALSLGRQLLVEVRVITDAEAYVAMYEENVERKEDSPYIQGQILRRALLSRTCFSQDDLACAFRLSHSKVSRLLMVAQLPSIVVAAFQSSGDIRESWGVELYQLWKNDDAEHAITGRARALTYKREQLPAQEVYETLITALGGKRTKHRLNRSVPVRGKNDAILFREQDQIGTVIFTVPKTILSPKRRDALKRAMVHILDATSTDSTSELPEAMPPECVQREVTASSEAAERSPHGTAGFKTTAALRPKRSHLR
jgi:ParB family chromosome partitioning protein